MKGQVRSLGLHPGWYNEPYRHSLAAKGVRTSLLSKKSQLIDEKYVSGLDKPGVPSSEAVNKSYDEYIKDFDTIIALKNLELVGLERERKVLSENPEDFSELFGDSAPHIRIRPRVEPGEEEEALASSVMNWAEGSELRRKAKKDFDENLLRDSYFSPSTYFEKEEELAKLGLAAKVPEEEFRDRFAYYHRNLGLDSDETKMALMSEFDLSPSEVEDELQELGPMRYAYKRKSMATKMDSELAHATGDYDFIGGKGDDPIDFISGNLKSTEDHSLDKWWSSVKYTLLHPFKDADGEWVEYNMLAGHPIHLSDDKMERAEQRGAAIFARVASQANIEPLIERGKNRSFRQVALDLAFGRRTGDEKDDEALIKRYEEKSGDVNTAFAAKKDLVKDVPGQNPRVTANYYRYRQEDPKKYDQFRVKVLPSGKKLVFGRKKTKSKHKLGKWEVQSILVPRVEVAQK